MTASRPTVVLLHSSASSARQWDSLATLLEPRFRVRAIDFHSHGKQPAWPGPAAPTLADEAALALGWVLAEADGAHVVGHSYGGAVALKLASMAPGSVRSVLAYEPVLFRWVLGDTTGRRGAGRGILDTVETMSGRLRVGDAHGAARRFIDFWSGGGTWDAIPPGAQEKIAERMPAVLGQFDALFEEPLDAVQLARLTVPMSFLSGGDTVAVTRRIAEICRVALPQARHEVLPGLAHMGPITHAAQVNARIVAHLEAHACREAPLEAVT
jgi:pimeloyl-ACP methyl ester carboxylesterase